MASTLLTTAAMRGHVETELTDEALELIIDAADAIIQSHYGAHSGERTVIRNGDTIRVWLPLPAQTVHAVREFYYTPSDASVVSVWQPSESCVMRVDGGYFAPWVEVRYTPVDNTAQRRLALVDLAKVMVGYDALVSFDEGETEEHSVVYDRERRHIINQLGRSIGYSVMAV